MAIREDYLLYHNPTSMGREFSEIAQSGLALTNKVGVANRAVANRGIIWCVGRRDILSNGKKEKRFFLFQCLVEPVAYENSDPEEGFKVTIKAHTTFRPGEELDITDEPYLPEIKKLVSLGFQRLTNKEVTAAFRLAYQGMKREDEL